MWLFEVREQFERVNTLWIGCQLVKGNHSVDVVLAWIWDPVEGVQRAVINTTRRLCCRGDESAVHTLWQLTINSPTQRPRVTARGKAAIAFLGRATVALEAAPSRTLLFEVACRRRDRIAGSCPMELVRKRHTQH